MEKINFKRLISNLEELELKFYDEFDNDLEKIISKYKILSNEKIIKKHIPIRDYIRYFLSKFKIEDNSLEINTLKKIKLSNYLEESSCRIKGIIDYSTDNFYAGYIFVLFYPYNSEPKEFLRIRFTPLEDDYYLVGIYSKKNTTLLLDQESELNNFIKSINRLLN